MSENTKWWIGLPKELEKDIEFEEGSAGINELREFIQEDKGAFFLLRSKMVSSLMRLSLS